MQRVKLSGAHQRNHAWCDNSIPPRKKKATPLLTFFSEDAGVCTIRTTRNGRAERTFDSTVLYSYNDQ
jgi:hypothetical protein